MYSLKNKNILISGIGKGLGKEMMIQCIKNGAKVYGFTRSKKDLKEIKFRYGNKAKFFHGDVNDKKFLKKLFNFFKNNKIILDGLINNAGIRQRKEFISITHRDLRNVIETNFISLFFLTQSFIKQASKT